MSFTFDYEQQRLSTASKAEIPEPGIQDIAIRQDGKIFAAGGWDGKIRVYSYRKMKPLAVLKVWTRSGITPC